MNTEARDQVRRLLDEQAALRRVATLVARGVSPADVFAAVSDEVGGLFGSEAAVARFEPDGSAMVVVGLTKGIPVVSIGIRWPLEDFLASTTVYRTGRPARNDHTGHRNASGSVAENLRKMDFISTVAAPIVVEGNLWGVMTVSDRREPLPPDTEERVAKFTELVATAIANAESRAELAASEARAHELAEEQAALRRVATLVAEGVPATELFSAVTKEVAHVFSDVDPSLVASVIRFDPGPRASSSALRGQRARTDRVAGHPRISTSRRGCCAPDALSASSRRTWRPWAGRTRTSFDWVASPSGGSPVVVEGRLWGALTLQLDGGAASGHRATPSELRRARCDGDCERDNRSELAASRERLIAASDDARRRIERDLHDGAQQQLVTLALAMRSTEGRIPTGQEQLKAEVGGFADRVTSVVEELREMSRGIHPAVLSEGGLSPALEALALRSAVPVKLDVRHEQRLPDAVEVAAYYVASEALTNASKHADASRVEIDLHLDDASLRLSICDDGGGGADPSRGSGLVGLKDRVEALGGTIDVESPHGRGTRLQVAIPVLADSSAG